MKLYTKDMSPFSSRVRICVYAKGLDVELDSDLPGGSMHSMEFARINPMEKIPVLAIDDWHYLPESQVIVEYLEDVHPEPSLLPPSAEDRARARLIARLVDLYLYPPVPQIFGAMHSEGQEERIKTLAADVSKGLDLLEHYLGGGEYCVGDQLSIADAALAPPLLFISGPIGNMLNGDPFQGRPKLQAVWKALQEDAHIARVLGEMKMAMAKFSRD
ncbi:hypothetical protein GOB17_26960 [Sinorhizobium meliloti]|uniref:glutathione S-transferase family protein n=1 Tax=Rhizobium meliloti TaxID=382 RepID=UPI000FDC8F9E|nr:glutathione S-transferase family protein [Sinorhizobium meliloti]MDX2329297.1 hypothetical protein [Sinorhizobium medicae]MDW9583237.1 hypothetical protein [Sinorhizobium meliloti]MDX0185362.1 hypothetical protein [Sinorhizobium meliloti]MDX0283767.1 hypothetical protein [Sinorhizobium meliloti]RVL29958.1 glutathione S-transferase family protein [Sinorhizobium meliloti]